MISRKKSWLLGECAVPLVLLALYFLPGALGACPTDTDLLRRVGKTRFYIVHRNERGNFSSFNDSVEICAQYGLELAKIKNMRTLAVVGRELEKMVDTFGLKDTWYWLDAKFNSRNVYEWGQHGTDGVVQFSNFLYRAPRPTGVAGFVDYQGEYHPNHDVAQCLALALPWPGKIEQKANGTAFGHQTMFDERPCESLKRRHVMCESKDANCETEISDPFVLTEDKVAYFEEGNWLFGERKYLVNWKHRTFNESEAYCKNLELELFKPNKSETDLLMYIKMWTRGVTTSQFWTAHSFNAVSKAFLDASKKQTTQGDRLNYDNSDGGLHGRSKPDTDYCLAMVLSYEFKDQLPCKDHGNPRCNWSFVEYVPANCNNYLATICQHKDERSRSTQWDPAFLKNVEAGLSATALTEFFGVQGYSSVRRSKYKQTFGSLYCPKGYRMLRASNDHLINGALGMGAASSGATYKYDFTESYWVVDEDLFDKKNDSLCSITVPVDGGKSRMVKKVKCTQWHFYACEQFYRKVRNYDYVNVPTPPKMEWKEGPQPRMYPITTKKIDGRSAQLFSRQYVPSDFKSLKNLRFILKWVDEKWAFTL